jgi:hypothetical protein
VIAGHSAGGQLVNRYAAGSDAEDFHSGFEFRYVVANPSSYLYLDAQRPVPGFLDLFSVPTPSEQSVCPGFDEYKHGLQELNPYMQTAGEEAILERYAR